MKKKLAVCLSILALAPVSLAACGDDEDEPTSEGSTEETTETDTGGGGGSTVDIAADPDGGLAYETTEAEAEAGSVTINFTNEASIGHDVVVEGDGGEIGATDVISGDSADLTVDLEAGDYTFYCSVGGHREAGMEGTLTVE